MIEPSVLHGATVYLVYERADYYEGGDVLLSIEASEESARALIGILTRVDEVRKVTRTYAIEARTIQ